MENKKAYNRRELMDLFKNGNIPSENDFEKLIESTLNLNEDGFSKNPEEGFVIKPEDSFNNFITFYKHKNDIDPFFSIAKEETGAPAVKIVPYNNSSASKHEELENVKDAQIYFHTNGAMGIGQQANKMCKLSVNGFTSMQGRTGSYLTGCVDADGLWKPIKPESGFFDGCQAFEIIARAGKPDSRKYAIMHAIALSAYGGKSSHQRIRRTCARYGFFWNRIRLRWRNAGPNNYWLEIKTSSHYSDGGTIEYRITKLWDDDFCSPPKNKEIK